MASGNDKATISCDLVLRQQYVRAIADSVEGDSPDGHKVAGAAIGLLEQLAEGGMMLPPLMVQQMQTALGRSPEIEDVLEQFERGAGRKGGKLEIQIHLDPVYESVCQEAADFNGYQTVEGYLQRLWDDGWENGWFHSREPQPHRVLMSAEDHAALKAILGTDFENGTKLAELVKAAVQNQNPLFDEVTT